MIKGDYDKLNNIAKINVCAEHKTPLEVAWYGQGHTWALRCGHDHYPDVLTRQLSLTEEYKAGADIPEPVKSNIVKGQRRRAMTQSNLPSPFKLGEVPITDLADGKSLTPSQVEALIKYAERYKLDIFRSHVVMMYGKPYVTIDGYLYHARRSGDRYSLISRPMTIQEEKSYKLSKVDHGWIAEVVFPEDGTKYNGTGIVTFEEITAKSPKDETKLRSPVVASHPWQLAQKRAEWQALRRAFPIGETTESVNEAGD